MWRRFVYFSNKPKKKAILIWNIELLIKGLLLSSHSSDQNYTYQFNLEIEYIGDSIESILVPFKKGQRERAVYIKDPVDFIHLDLVVSF